MKYRVYLGVTDRVGHRIECRHFDTLNDVVAWVREQIATRNVSSFDLYDGTEQVTA